MALKYNKHILVGLPLPMRISGTTDTYSGVGLYVYKDQSESQGS